jgi:hypothetical protein
VVSQAQQVRRVIGSCGVITILSVFIWWLSHNHGIDKCQIMLCVCGYVCRAKRADMCGRTEGSHIFWRAVRAASVQGQG